MDPSPERFIRIRHFPGILATPHIHPRLSRICVLPLHGQYALHLRCVHKHTLQLHNERERKIPHWGACHAGEHATLRNMPRWGTCHAGEHADRSPWITYHFNALQMRHTFHHAANTPQLHLRNASALTHNRFFLYRRHIQILGSSSLLYDSSGPSTARKICGPHQYSRTRIRSTVQATS